ncbi:hypothetical protein N9A38_00320 [Gammaproteobacteria bacterium]|nr:hypothetical protein [Gammaproteobacteria bacterium]
MIAIKNYNFDYYRYLFLTSSVILFGILLKIFDKRPYVIFETALLLFGLLFALIYIAENTVKLTNRSKFFILFLIYLFVYNLSAAFIRTFDIHISIFDSLLFGIQEFRLSTVGYFLPLLFLPLASYEKDKIIAKFLLLAKIAIVYTIFEQFVSTSGYRTFFESIYFNSGVVTSNQIGIKSFGIYRIWGLIGSPQILGIFHIMTLALMLHSKQKLWAYLSLLCIFLSTSKTAILVLVLLSFLYLIVKRKYLLFFLISIMLTLLAFWLYNINEYLVSSMSSDYFYLQKFVGSIQGYFILISNTLDYHPGLNGGDGVVHVNQAGPLMRVYHYFSENPLEVFFGKGITFSFMQSDQLMETVFGNKDIKDANQLYVSLSSDFYILTYFEQYGIFGTLFLSLMYFIYPVILLFKKHSYILYIPISFYIATFHYPPQISKIIMLFLALSVWLIYFQNNNKSKINGNPVPMQ